VKKAVIIAVCGAEKIRRQDRADADLKTKKQAFANHVIEAANWRAWNAELALVYERAKQKEIATGHTGCGRNSWLT